MIKIKVTKSLCVSVFCAFLVGVLFGSVGIELLSVSRSSQEKKQKVRQEIVKEVEEEKQDKEKGEEKEKKEEKKVEKKEVFVSQNSQEELSDFGFPKALYEIRNAKVKKNQFFASLLEDYGVSQSEIYNITQESKDVFDMRKFKSGYPYEAYISKENGDLDYLVYEQDNLSYVVFTFKDSLNVEVFEKKMETRIKYSEVTINSSLWIDTQEAGVNPLLSIKLADIYAWTIDFFGLREGDSYKALYEEVLYKGEVINIGRVLYAEFTHIDEQYLSYHFEEDQGGNEYWNEKGESLRKAFLKAPLNFTRISSGFTYNRKHPITRKVQPHTGIDYAAPTGTPVMSIGDGVIVQRGAKGLNGNMVTIKHNSVYKSAYLHLSRFAPGLKVGSKVSQGQVIGYVGSTGRSTGPHLDFRVWKNDQPINPLAMKSPPTKPIDKKNESAFKDSIKDVEDIIIDMQAKDYILEFTNQYF